jgi:origin recognition complex subunit 1
LDPFDVIEINGMRLSEPSRAYSTLWEGLTGDKVSPAYAESLLSTRFRTPSSNRSPCVVLMDELDLLVTKRQSVVYNFFEWPHLKHSRLIVIAIANTMDLPERALSNKVSSRLGCSHFIIVGRDRLVFNPYKFDQLETIVNSRVKDLNCFHKDAIILCARKVASVSGDARRCLDICRYGRSFYI